jgi:hypothetical protein
MMNVHTPYFFKIKKKIVDTIFPPFSIWQLLIVLIYYLYILFYIMIPDIFVVDFENKWFIPERLIPYLWYQAKSLTRSVGLNVMWSYDTESYEKNPQPSNTICTSFLSRRIIKNHICGLFCVKYDQNRIDHICDLFCIIH